MTSVATIKRDTKEAGRPTTTEADAAPVPRRLHAQLSTFGEAEPIRCEVDHLGESGFEVMAPVTWGFAVGQRYEVTIAENDSSKQLVGEGHYATVISTESFPQSESINVGMRFDQPLMI